MEAKAHGYIKMAPIRRGNPADGGIGVNIKGYGLEDYFLSFAALTADEHTVLGISHADALEIVILHGSVLVGDLDISHARTSCIGV